ncbi:MAG: hypothetical protein COA99_19855 [Moraxellaceae bacterium]|nr:MAG: hypothetical protein COA99_19855 [Moraxellaceae bacterium]
MSAVFSIIVVANDSNASSLKSLERLENEQVELLICSNETGLYDAPLLGAAIEQCSGLYTLILTEKFSSLTEEWMNQLAAQIEDRQLIGHSGYARLNAAGAEVQTTCAVVEAIGAASSGRNMVASRSSVEAPVALTDDYLFAATSFFREQPFSEIDVLAGNFVGRYSLRMKLNGYASLLSIADESSDEKEDRQPIAKFLHGYEGLFPINDLGTRCWQRNAQALRLHDEGAAAAIIDGMFTGVDLQFKQKQKGRIVVTGKKNDVMLSDANQRLDQLPSDETVILFGVGAGELVDKLLRETNNEVVVVEPEAKLINYLWMRYDWSAYVESGRLRYLSIANDHAILQSISISQVSRFLQTLMERSTFASQVLRSGSYHLYSEFYQSLEVSLNWFLRLKKISNTWVGKGRLVYDVTIVSPRCAIFVDLAECLHRQGARTRILNVPDRAGELTEDKIIQLLASLNVDASKLVLYRNRSFIESENVALAAGLEDRVTSAQLSWWWDVPNVASYIDMQAAAHSRPAIGFAGDMLSSLPEGSMWLPPAAQNSFCTEDIYQGELIPEATFVGQSRISHLTTQLKVISEILPILGGTTFSVLQELFERFDSYSELHQRIEAAVGDIEGELDKHIIKMPAQVYYLKYILRMAESAAFRVASIERLVVAKVPLAVYGDKEWLTSGVVPRHLYRGVIERKALRPLYERSKLNLNLNFMQVSSTVNPKVLDISACGGRVLTDHRQELNVLYPDANIRPHSFTSIDTLPDTVNELLSEANPISGEAGDLRAIAERTRSQHSMEVRARWFIENFGLM